MRVEKIFNYGQNEEKIQAHPDNKGMLGPRWCNVDCPYSLHAPAVIYKGPTHFCSWDQHGTNMMAPSRANVWSNVGPTLVPHRAHIFMPPTLKMGILLWACVSVCLSVHSKFKIGFLKELLYGMGN